MPYKFLPQNVFTSPSLLPCSSGISNVALSSLIYQDFCPFYTNQYLPRAMIGIGDYTLTTFDYIMY